MTFDGETKLFKQFRGLFAVARAIAGRIIGWHVHQFLEECDLASKIIVNEIAHALKPSMNLMSAAIASPISAGLAYSAGL